MNLVTITTSGGKFLATFSDAGLTALEFPGDCNERTAGNVDSNWVTTTRTAIEAILHGEAYSHLPPLDLKGSAFQKSVWQVLQRIPRGETRTYSEVAAEIGLPGAARAVGNACGANPIPLLIPCHRVIAAGQRLGGFSGGLEWKKKLLAVETVMVLH